MPLGRENATLLVNAVELMVYAVLDNQFGVVDQWNLREVREQIIEQLSHVVLTEP